MADLMKWPVFNLLEPEFIQQIRLVLIYDEKVCNPLIVTNHHNIFTLSYNSGNFIPQQIKAGHSLLIKTVAYMKGPYIFILTFTGEVYLIDKDDYNNDGFISEQCKLAKMNHVFCNEMIEDIACGETHFLVVTFSGKVYETIINDSAFESVTEDAINLNNRIVSISCGSECSAAVTDDGMIHIWIDDSDITTITELTTINKIVCGYLHFMALSNEGDVYTWGSNIYGQLGNGTYVDSSKPERVKQITNVVDIATSSNHDISIAMGEGNLIFIWGSCLGQNISVPTPTTLSSIHDAFACYASPRIMHQPLVNNCNFNLLDSLRDAFNNEDTSDLTIKLHGKSVHVHKSILILRCQHFRKKFLEDPVYNSARQCISIDNEMFSYNVYKAFLEYLYTDKINLPPEDTFELLQLADYYSMNQLKKYCKQTIYKNIKVKNVLNVYNLAIKYHAKDLEDYCFKFALRNMTAVIGTPNFVELDGSIAKYFMIKAAETNGFRT
nr:RCC1 and BTB domain-containing protein 1-like [Megalopta genalis]